MRSMYMYMAAVLPVLVGTRLAISLLHIMAYKPSSPLVGASFYHCLIVC